MIMLCHIQSTSSISGMYQIGELHLGGFGRRSPLGDGLPRSIKSAADRLPQASVLILTYDGSVDWLGRKMEVWNAGNGWGLDPIDPNLNPAFQPADLFQC